MGKEKKGRQYQDTIFRKYFNDEKRLKEIAGVLHGRSYAEEPLKIVTLEGTFLPTKMISHFCWQDII